jgi:hypothetical protein
MNWKFHWRTVLTSLRIAQHGLRKNGLVFENYSKEQLETLLRSLDLSPSQWGNATTDQRGDDWKRR